MQVLREEIDKLQEAGEGDGKNMDEYLESEPPANGWT